MSEPDVLLANVERFLAETGMTPTAFGARCLNDPMFVFELRSGREVRRKTRARVEEFIRNHSRKPRARRRSA